MLLVEMGAGVSLADKAEDCGKGGLDGSWPGRCAAREAPGRALWGLVEMGSGVRSEVGCAALQGSVPS